MIRLLKPCYNSRRISLVLHWIPRPDNRFINITLISKWWRLHNWTEMWHESTSGCKLSGAVNTLVVCCPRKCRASRKASEAGGVTFTSTQVHRPPEFFSRLGTPVWEQCCWHLQQLVIKHHLWKIRFGHWEPLASVRIGSDSVFHLCRWTTPWQ